MYSERQQVLFNWFLEQGFDFDDIVDALAKCDDEQRVLNFLIQKKAENEKISSEKDESEHENYEVQEKNNEKNNNMSKSPNKADIIEKNIKINEEIKEKSNSFSSNNAINKKKLRVIKDKPGKHPLIEFSFEKNEIENPKKKQIIKKKAIPYKINKSPLEYFNFSSFIKKNSHSQALEKNISPLNDKKKIIEKPEIIQKIQEEDKKSTDPPLKPIIKSQNLNNPPKPEEDLDCGSVLKTINDFKGLKNQPKGLIIRELMKLGIPEELAAEAGKSCANLEEAMVNLGLQVPKLSPQKPVVSPQSNTNEQIKPNNKGNNVKFKESEKEDEINSDIISEYSKILSPLKVIITEKVDLFINYSIQKDEQLGPKGVKRINKEIKAMNKALPCDNNKAIYFMILKKNMNKICCLVSGTVNTPYSYGLYLLDIFLPTNYPQNPPIVLWKTTGNHSFQFNPLLHPNGLVCLPIINTWVGQFSECWNPKNSSILSVCTSIQAFLMNNFIIQKQQHNAFLPENSPENIAYQYVVKYGNIRYAIIDQIKNPPPGFEDIIYLHFRLNKTNILNTVWNWVEQSQNQIIPPGLLSQNSNIYSLLEGESASETFLSLYYELNECLNSPRFN